MIPPDKSAAVTLGLNETFGVTEFEDILDLTERPGSNRAFRIIVRGSAYLLRINTRPGDMARQFACMQAAADSGLAPRVRYTSTEDRISITDFVEAVPLPAPEALVRIPAALRALHAMAPFPTAPFNTTCTFLLNEGPALDDYLKRFRVSSILPANDTEELLARYRQVAAVYSRLDSDQAPGHNDLFKPDNMLQEFLPKHRPTQTLGTGTSVCFMCEDALALYREFKSRGIQVRKRPFVGNRLWVVPLTDPDGYRIEFESPTDAPEESELEE